MGGKMEKIKNNYNHTIYASYLGSITQAIINNYIPLLFITLHNAFDISLEKIGLLVSFNFAVQLLVDFLAARYVDRIGYRNSIVAAHVFAAAGLVGLGFLPDMLGNPYVGIIGSILLYALGGGLIEVLTSPIVEACPTEKKEQAMSLLHSFYCWGHVGVVLISTLFFQLAGRSNWRILSFVWAIIPIINMFYYAIVPLRVLVEEGQEMSIKELVREKLFWVFLLLMVCAGASEQGMSQWASAFAESGLNISKTAGDLAGPCLFAILMGTSRLIYGKWGAHISLDKFMKYSTFLCIVSYLMAALLKSPILSLTGCGLCGLSVGIMWPGTFSIAAKKFKRGATTMFAMFALAGDLGCAAGPAVVGGVSGRLNGNLKLGILSGIVFPLLLLGGLILLQNNKYSSRRVA
jgi:MFS family permease